MPKTYIDNAEQMSAYLKPIPMAGDDDRLGERPKTSPFGDAKIIDIERIKPDPDQPRKSFNQETIESLSESIRELGGIIDPLTVEYVEALDHFRIVSGERRYRAAKIAGLDKLPCIIKYLDDHQRLLMQLVANLQRENIAPLEEAAGMRAMMEKFNYPQTKIAMLLNKSKGYISQVLGLERLGESARKIVQTSELPKEIQIYASREKDPQKQVEILSKASTEKMTVRQLRKDSEADMPKLAEESPIESETGPESVAEMDPNDYRTFQDWHWEPKDGRFTVSVRFYEEQNENDKKEIISNALKEALESIF